MYTQSHLKTFINICADAGFTYVSQNPETRTVEEVYGECKDCEASLEIWLEDFIRNDARLSDKADEDITSFITKFFCYVLASKFHVNHPILNGSATGAFLADLVSLDPESVKLYATRLSMELVYSKDIVPYWYSWCNDAKLWSTRDESYVKDGLHNELVGLIEVVRTNFNFANEISLFYKWRTNVNGFLIGNKNSLDGSPLYEPILDTLRTRSYMDRFTEKLDRNNGTIPVAGGYLVDVCTGKKRLRVKSDLFTDVFPVTEDIGRPELLFKYFSDLEVDPRLLVTVFRLIVGATPEGYVNSDKFHLVLYGPNDGGKNTFLRLCQRFNLSNGKLPYVIWRDRGLTDEIRMSGNVRTQIDVVSTQSEVLNVPIYPDRKQILVKFPSVFSGSTRDLEIYDRLDTRLNTNNFFWMMCGVLPVVKPKDTPINTELMDMFAYAICGCDNCMNKLTRIVVGCNCAICVSQRKLEKAFSNPTYDNLDEVLNDEFIKNNPAATEQIKDLKTLKVLGELVFGLGGPPDSLSILDEAKNDENSITPSPSARSLSVAEDSDDESSVPPFESDIDSDVELPLMACSDSCSSMPELEEVALSQDISPVTIDSDSDDGINSFTKV